ncbi:hypothetical protein AJ80_04480 [Polytolypa hystricis UAMH7299]|uniref:Zn(2)-C6 fungal-type domain-containing protein n=1 Tax=Polytolypa hystricis (strain UAMH7299) TaxID=1447883 RepID=A0A2B7YBE4_POLH7|nr:hypothetical protein AJ80_04480 [Polytolypa hystricis UAMH7299]
MQNFSFVPPNAGLREGQKNYVFVDEHNRHKRLKVMRACNGCRKRKIRCDSASTNTWPCSACTRLKLVCVPPAIGQDADLSSYGQAPEPNKQQAHPIGPPNLDPMIPNTSQSPLSGITTSDPLGGVGYSDDPRLYQMQSYLAHSQDPRGLYPDVHSSHLGTIQHSLPHPTTVFPTPPSQQSIANVDTGSSPGHDQSTADGLSDALGELRIDETGVAPYIRQQRRGQREPAVSIPDDDDDAHLPPLTSVSGAAIRIPPELMPSDEDAMEYFDIFFNHIHPYIPVVHRTQLYQQWQNDKASISPLLLEAIFACAGRMSDDPAQGAQWLALANRHESAFMEAPRLSTLQALLVLLKAREAVPKKGYYYRSWQTVKLMVAMAKDLELHDHYGYHAEGKSCGLDSVECLIQTRIWQSLMVVEIMIAGSQGRSDLGVDPDTIEIRPAWNISEIDSYEAERSRQFAYFVRNARILRIFTDAYHKVKRLKDWGADPRFMVNNPLFSDFLASLPPDLQVTYPPDGSPPWLPTHFVGNLHCHFHLGIIMMHRPQLVASKSFTAGGEWRTHMTLCYSSAKTLCRLQEAILGSFGLNGLLYMLRGVNFTIYAILTCTMLHLIAITSPDPEFNTDARSYFARHMRLLEQCMSSWPMPEIQSQIDALRLAFSADTNKPFELKRSFPYGSPSESYRPSPPLDSQYLSASYGQVNSAEHSRLLMGAQSLTPPPSSNETTEKSESSSLHAMTFMQGNGQDAAILNVPLTDGNNWDPSRIISQWDLAFPGGSSSSTNSPQSNPPSEVQNVLPSQYDNTQFSQQAPMASITPAQAMPQAPYNTMQPVMFSARDWQRSVASVYDPHGFKRKWAQSPTPGQQRANRMP